MWSDGLHPTTSSTNQKVKSKPNRYPTYFAVTFIAIISMETGWQDTGDTGLLEYRPCYLLSWVVRNSKLNILTHSNTIYQAQYQNSGLLTYWISLSCFTHGRVNQNLPANQSVSWRKSISFFPISPMILYSYHIAGFMGFFFHPFLLDHKFLVVKHHTLIWFICSLLPSRWQ